MPDHLGQSEATEWAECAECGDTGLMSVLAPCTTFDRDCACNGPRVEAPCEFCEAGVRQAKRHGSLWGRTIAVSNLSRNDESESRDETVSEPTNTSNVYERFIEEQEAMTIVADESAVAVIGRLIRAVKRAQMVVDGELAPVSERGPRKYQEAHQ
jgi:hypothetical protein